MKNFKANVETKFYRIIPFLIGYGETIINKKSKTFSLFITPFIKLSFNRLGTLNKYDIVSSDLNETNINRKKKEVKKILQKKFNYTDDVLTEQISKIYEEK